MDDIDVGRYLARIGAARPARVDAEALRDLQACHLRSVPFENLSIHLGEPISLDEAALLDKIVTRRRGGFCYEVNGLFAELLRALGFRVSLLAAKVYAGVNTGIPFSHVTLRVDLDEPWLADVGFGAFAHHPLRLDERGAQVDPGGVFRVEDAAAGDLVVYENGEPQLLVETRPRDLDDFLPSCWWHQTSPKSHFTKGDVCSLPTEDGRVTLRRRRLIRTGPGDARSDEKLAGDAEILDVYRDVFGVVIPRVPGGPPPAGR